ncbi:nuclear transport factor 2 family protein, partial [Fulvimonas soli]
MGETHRQHAIGLVQAYYAAFNRGDWDGMLAFLADDVAHDLNQG